MIFLNIIYYFDKGVKIIDFYIIILEGKRVNYLVNCWEYYYIYRVKFINLIFKIRFGMLIKIFSGFELGGVFLYGYIKLVEYIVV